MAEKVIRDIAELKEGARSACVVFMEACRLAGLDIFITETYRTQARQRELYSQGRSKPGKKVTNTLNSKHTARQAWDICFKSTGFLELSKFYRAGEIGESLGIEWGGSWQKSKDLPHYQYLGGVYMLPTAYAEARKLADTAVERGIITNGDLWYSYMTGLRECRADHLKALFIKVTGSGGGLDQIVNKAADMGIISNAELWARYISGAKLPPGNLRALFQKIIAAGN